MASDVIGKGGGTISREQTTEPVYVVVEDNGHDCQFVEIETKDGRGVSIPSEQYPGQHFMRRIGPLYRSLPSIAPDAIEAEYREAAVAWAEANVRYQDDGTSRGLVVAEWRRFSAAKSARDGAR